MRGKLGLGAFALGVVVAAALVPGLVSAREVVSVSAKLTGAKEVPGPGDPNGEGEFIASLKTHSGKICFQISHERIQKPDAGHIHKGARDEAGPVKATLFSSRQPSSTIEKCKKIGKRLVRRIARNPGRYYVNLHNEQYPDGAIRGQIRRAL